MATKGYSGVRVFTATKARDRDALGDQVSAWVASHPGIVVVGSIVRQSSDTRFHCLSIVLFYDGPLQIETDVDVWSDAPLAAAP